MCNNIAIIQGGRLVASGDVDKISHRLSNGRQLEIRVLDHDSAAETLQILQDLPDISNVVNGVGNLIYADFSGDEQALHSVLAALLAKNMPIVSFAPRNSGGRLEDVFMSITEGSNPS
jgi:ABC-2 type transport system ATP-binding protein